MWKRGTRGPVDLKKTKLAGKIVPLPVNSIRGKTLTVVGKNGVRTADPGVHSVFVGRFSSKQTSTRGLVGTQQRATTGKSMGTKYVLFRRVPKRGGTGWIIPQRPAAPFMKEAAQYVTPMLAEAVGEAYARFAASNNI